MQWNNSMLWKGYLPGIVASITFGMNPLFGLPLYRAGLTPLSVLFYRFFFGSIMLAAVMLIRNRACFYLPRRQLLHVMIGGLLVALSCLMWFLSFNIMDSGIGASILFVYPIMVAVIMGVGYGEKLSLPIILGILFALVGVSLLCSPGEGAKVSLRGILYVLLSALFYAVYMVEVKVSRLRELHPDTLTFYMLITGWLVLLVVLRGGMDIQRIPDLASWGNALGLAFFPSFLSFLLIAVAIQNIGATKAALLGALEPLTAVVIGIFVFSEQPTWRMFCGIALILLSVSFVIKGKKPSAMEKEHR